ncbi:hypothetical protein HPB51_017252 [Rhipicephalus microplus]|uniref:PPM-type phosphatase domain-containing protein n=1 Tax=Rhipicephalus microplus TaxID=6941 RepID=A0A9J6EUH7_RHIMP|nr:hypothetical protein HPB51_017252 [Rhipicephalus microplus]
MDMPVRSESTDGSGSSGRNGSNDMLPAADTWGSWHVAGESRNRCLQFRVKNDHARVSCLLCATSMGSPRWLVPFVGRRLPRELAKRLAQASEPELVQAALCSSLQAVHDAWLQSLEPTLSRRDELLRATDQGPGEASLAALEAELSSGCSLALAVVMNGNQLYVANLGRTRVLLLRGGEEPKLLTVEHSIDNADELARLVSLGVDTDALTEEVVPVTRCLGAHPRRRRPDGPDPVSNEPEFCGPLEVEPGWRLLFLSDGLCKALNVSGMLNQEANRLVAKLASQPGTAREALSQLLDRCELPTTWSHELTLMVVSLCEEEAPSPAPVSDGRVDPYVDFTPLISALEAAR